MKKQLLLILALCVPGAVNAQAVTMDFTATVTDALGTFSSIVNGSEVTGTYTFNFDNAASASENPVGGVFGWSAVWGSNEDGVLPTTGGYVFTSTAQVFNHSNAVVATYSTNTSGAYVSSEIQGNQVGIPAQWFASEGQDNTLYGGQTSGSQVEIYNGGDGTGAYFSTGLPDLVLPDPNTHTGEFYEGGLGNVVVYQLDSLTLAPVPIPGAAWLLLSGLGGLALMGRRWITPQPLELGH